MPPRLKPSVPDAPRRRNRTSPGGTLRFDRDLTRLGVGRIQCSSGTDSPTEFEFRNGIITKLVEDGDVETLRALKHGEISVQELAQAHRKGRLATALQEARAARARAASALQVQTATVQSPLSTPVAPQLGTTNLPPEFAAALADTTDPVRALGLAVMQWFGGAPGALSGQGEPLVGLLQALRLWGSAAGQTAEHSLMTTTATTMLPASTPTAAEAGSRAWTASPAHPLARNSLPSFPIVSAPETVWPQESLPLWDTLLTRVIPLLDCGPETKRRYTVSLESLRRKLPLYEPDPEVKKKMTIILGPDDPKVDYVALATEVLHGLASDTATVGDLRRVHKQFWASLQRQWGSSPADWNHMRRALSATLTGLFGYPGHEFRYRVLGAIALQDEGPGRVPDLTPEVFWQIIDHMPEHAKPGPVVLVATGMRVKEYLGTGREHLLPNTHGIKVPGTKTTASADTIYVAEEIWPWIDAGIPAPLQRRWLWVYWQRACKAVGIEDLHLHDLRHCLGQWSVTAGCNERDVQWALRHRDPSMTRRYTMTRGKREVASAMGRVLSR